MAYHNIKNEYNNKQINVKWIAGNDNIADIFTKPLAPKLFLKHRSKIVVKNPYKQ